MSKTYDELSFWETMKYNVRRRVWCQYPGCYVLTPARRLSDGKALCLACQDMIEEGNLNNV